MQSSRKRLTAYKYKKTKAGKHKQQSYGGEIDPRNKAQTSLSAVETKKRVPLSG